MANEHVDKAFREILAGIESPGALAAQAKLETIRIAYDRALSDKATVLPTYLHAALEAARK